MSRRGVSLLGRVTRTGFASALLLASVAAAQPATYFAPIVGRTPPNTPVPGAAPLQVAFALSDPGVAVNQSILFGTAGQLPGSYLVATLLPAAVSGLPATVDAVATAPGVVVGTGPRTLLAVSSGGTVTFGTLESTGFMARGPSAPVAATNQLALSVVPDGGAALLVSDGFLITRWDLDVSSGTVVASKGFTGPAAPGPGGDDSRSLALDGLHDIGFVGGNTVGDLYIFDARLDAGPPRLFDGQLASQGRLAPPVSGLALYGVNTPLYLLAANGQGLTLYPLGGASPVTVTGILRTSPQDGGIRIIATDSLGQITSPQGVALTNLPAGPSYPAGLVVLGSPATRVLATLSWDALSRQLDGGLRVDTTDPRAPSDGGADGGPDGGPPDAGDGGGGPGPPPQSPLSPGIKIEHSSSCASTAGAPALVGLLAVLALLVPRRRQRR